MSSANPQCFVIMPFGEKQDVDGRVIDFDKIYADIIEPAVTGAAMQAAGGPALQCLRCDKIAQAGWVHRQMIESIERSAVVVVDLSTLNPNVFYELGARHALRGQVTVLICRLGTSTPFNLQGQKCIFYNAATARGRAQARTEIAEFIANGLRTGANDSLVHEVLKLPGQAAAATRLPAGPAQRYALDALGPGRSLALLTGDLRFVSETIDVWVNSENTDMQMARFFDKSGSAVIRYLGARRDPAGQVLEDTIAIELAAQMGSNRRVPAGSVLVTGSGALADSHGVQRLFHLAAVQGELGQGYSPVKDVEACVTNALMRADDKDLRGLALRSLLLPLIGTGSGGAHLEQAIAPLLDATLGYFARRPQSGLTTVYFQAFTDQQLDTCKRLLAQRGARPLAPA